MHRRDVLKLGGAATGAGLLTATAAPSPPARAAVSRGIQRIYLDHEFAASSRYGSAVSAFARGLSLAGGGRLEVYDPALDGAQAKTPDHDLSLRLGLQSQLAGDNPCQQLFAGLPERSRLAPRDAEGSGALETWYCCAGGRRLWANALEAFGRKHLPFAFLPAPIAFWSNGSLGRETTFATASFHATGLTRALLVQAFADARFVRNAEGPNRRVRQARPDLLDCDEAPGTPLVAAGEDFISEAGRLMGQCRSVLVGQILPGETVLAAEVDAVAWSRLPADLQAIVGAVLQESGNTLRQETRLHVALAHRALARAGNVSVARVPVELGRRLDRATEELLELYRTRDPLASAVVASLDGFRRASTPSARV